MYKSAVWTVENANGATAEQSGNNLVITKTEKTGSLDATLTITDVYDRTTTYTYTIKVINAIVNITDFTFTVDGVENTANSYTSSGHGIGYISFKGIQLGYVIAPETPLQFHARLKIPTAQSLQNQFQSQFHDKEGIYNNV